MEVLIKSIIEEMEAKWQGVDGFLVRPRTEPHNGGSSKS